MNAKLMLALLASAAFVNGCAGQSTGDESSPDTIGSTESPIEGGEVVNGTADPVSRLFPLSTVNLRTMVTLPDGGVQGRRCTGVILSSTKILTAAHCKVNSTTQVYLYPTTVNGGALPTGTVVNASGTTPAVQTGVVCDPDVPGSVPATCYASSNGGGSHFADLAILTLASSIPLAPSGPYQQVGLAPRDSFTANVASWAVGTGWMNFLKSGCDAGAQNPSYSMQWVATDLLSGSDNGGIIYTRIVYGDPGDSGGPIYQKGRTFIGPLLPGTYNLILVGILSDLPRSPCSNTNPIIKNEYTSVQQPDNYDWITQQGGVVSPYITSFGASLAQ
jgi:Trypsin